MGWKPETILAGQVFGVTSPQEIQELALSSRYPPVISHMFLRCYRVNGPSIGVLCICISMACICIYIIYIYIYIFCASVPVPEIVLKTYVFP